MLRNTWFPRIVVTLLGMVVAAQAWATPEFARQTKAACVACHVNPAGGAEFTDAGKAYQAEQKAPAATTAKAADYVGSNKCKMCHIKQHKAWLETPHVKSLTNLQAADPTTAAEMSEKLKVAITGSPAATDGCIKCHVTGFHLAGGYPAADSTKTAAVAAVGCEACHGPGSLHVAAPIAAKKKFINKVVGEKLCKSCHMAEISPKFEFAEWSKKGVHQVPKAQ